LLFFNCSFSSSEIAAHERESTNVAIVPIRFKNLQDILIFNTPEIRAWWSGFDKSKESAMPGQYNVFLETPRVEVSLVAMGTHAGLHQYEWLPEHDLNDDDLNDDVDVLSIGKDWKEMNGLVFDACHSAATTPGRKEEGEKILCKDSTIIISKDLKTIQSKSLSHENNWFYFHGEMLSDSFLAQQEEFIEEWTICSEIRCLTPIGSIKNNSMKEKKNEDNSERKNSIDVSEERNYEFHSATGHLYAIATLATRPTSNEKLSTSIQFQVGISSISIDLARDNLYSSLNDIQIRMIRKGPLPVEVVKEKVADLWCQELNFLSLPSSSLDTNDEAQKTLLYSASYRSLLSTSFLTESNGQYLGADNQVYFKKESSTRSLSSSSSVDLLQSKNIWMLLTHSDMPQEILQSLQEEIKKTDASSCTHGLVFTILDICLMNENLCAKVLDLSMLQQSLSQQFKNIVSLEDKERQIYLSNGFVSKDVSNRSVLLTVSYSYDDFLPAQLSRLVNDTKSASEFLPRSKNYRQLWSKEHQMFCAKSFNSMEFDCSTELNQEASNHLALFIGQYDPAGLISLFPSYDAFYQWLENLLLNSFQSQSQRHENELYSMASWLFSYSNEIDGVRPNSCLRTQYWTRKMMNTSFTNYSSHELVGSETWLLFSSLGFFPHSLSNHGRFILGSPSISYAFMNLSRNSVEGDQVVRFIEMIARDYSPENIFVERLLVNGVEHRSPFIDYLTLSQAGGCRLEFFLSSSPKSSLCP
jgi:putative alpha-1,2-mannosidase